MAASGDLGVRVPPDLHAAPPRTLEEYTRARILQFAQAFAARLNPTVAPSVVQQAALDCLQALPPPDYSGVALEHRDLQLVFRHDCLSLGCLDAQCVLCEHNPHRRCSVNFSPKYLVNDILKAKCEAPIRVELIDRATGQPISEDLPDVVLEMCVLDGNAYETKVVEAGEEREEDLEAAALLLNNKAQALLQAGPAATHNANSKVQMTLSKGVAVLPDLHISDSSEAMLSGRKPPFRLLVKAVHLRGAHINIRHAVSEGFVVATRRTRTAGKVEIPNVDDHISKLEHMGKETVKKLSDIRGSAQAAGMDINVPDNTINKVGEFRRLALLAEADGHLRQKLQQVLKLSKEKWDEARDHAMRAVVADNRMRIWYADKSNMDVGLLFTCRLGDVDLDRPVGLLTKKAQEGAQTTMEATLMAQQTPAQREQVRQLQPQAVAAWWQQGHPGWAIYPVDSEQFLATGTLDSAALPMPTEPLLGPMLGGVPSFAQPNSSDGGNVSSPPPAMPAGLPGAPPLPAAAAAAAAAAFNPAMASAFMGAAGGLPSEALLRVMSPFLHGAGGGVPPQLAGLAGTAALPQRLPPGLPSLPNAANASGGGGRDGSPRDAAGTSAFADAAQLPTNGSGGAPGAATPFAAAGGGMPPPPPVAGRAPEPAGSAAGGPGGGPSAALSLAGLSGLFGGDLSRLPQLAGLANFPSIPPGMMSGDLEQLLMTQGSLPDGAASLFAPGRAPSFNIGKLESLNLPDEALAAAMLQMERAGMTAGASLPAPRQAQQGAAPAVGPQGEGQQAGQQQQQQQQQAGVGEERQQGRQPSQGKDAAAANNNASAARANGSQEGEGQRLTPAKRKA